MSDWYKVYNVAEECGISSGTAIGDQHTAIKEWLEREFGDYLECTITSYPNVSTSKSGLSCLNVFLKDTGSNMGFYHGMYYYNSSTSPYVYGLGYKTGANAVYGTPNSSSSSTSTVNCSYSSELSASEIAYLRLKFIKTKYFYIIDFYRENGYAKKCRLLVADFNGEKISVFFGGNGLYYIKSGTTDRLSGGGFLYSYNADIKKMQAFITPWSGEEVEHFYTTDNVVDDNKPYILNGKTYIDICGGTAYRGLACEVVLGDSELLYGSETSDSE